MSAVVPGGRAAARRPGVLTRVRARVREVLTHPAVPWVLWATGLVVLAVGWYGPQPGPMLLSAVILLVACAVCVARTPRVSYLAWALLSAYALFLIVRPVLDVVVDYPEIGRAHV